MKTALGLVTFGNLDFTKLALKSIKETSSTPLDFVVVVGKPGDFATINWLANFPEIKTIVHSDNFGFPYSVNDIYDYVWKESDYDNLILAGNDIVAYPTAIDKLIAVAESSDYEVVSANQVDVRDLVRMYPEAGRFFSGSSMIFSDFTQRPWELFTEHSHPISIKNMQLFDIQNLCLYKKSSFDKVGYTDVNFYPAYFVDNDYARRIVNAGVKCCTIETARFFHFWSRTIKQGTGGSNNQYFENNKAYYADKWGGDFGHESTNAPVKIDSRESELASIRRWKR